MRLKAVKLIIIAGFSVLIITLINIQIVQGTKFFRLSENNRIRLKPMAASRGRIYDRKGRILADNRLSFEVKVTPHLLKGETGSGRVRRYRREDTLKKLAAVLGEPEESLINRLRRNEQYSQYMPFTIARDVKKEKAIVIMEKYPEEMPGVTVEAASIRSYPFDSAAAHVIGYLGRISEKEYEDLSEYGFYIDDVLGRSGAEKSFDRFLRGQNGGHLIEVDRLGRMKKVLGEEPAVSGASVYLTIDIELQQFVEELLGTMGGAIVVMEARTGEILAMASYPGFDPNIFITPSAEKRVKKILSGRAGNLLNRSINCSFPPGSVFKIVTAACGLETEAITPEDSYVCPGEFKYGRRTFRCWQHTGHGRVNLKRALARSCNVFFYQLGLKEGVDNLAIYGRLFGFGELTGIELFGETSGLVPTRKWKKSTGKGGWYGGDTVNLSIGQGYLNATPLQVLKMVSVIANSGIGVDPHIVGRIEGVSGHAREYLTRAFFTGLWKGRRSPVISQRTAGIIREGLREAVVEPSGTGHRAYVAGIGGAGKTGTAAAGKGKTHAWFVGFSPVEDPQVCLVVFLEKGGRGGDRAAEIAGEIWKRLLKERS